MAFKSLQFPEACSFAYGP